MSEKSNFIYGETFSREAPRPSPVVYEILSDSIETEGENIESRLALDDAYQKLNSREPEISMALADKEQKGAISRYDHIILVVLLASSQTLGPNLDFLRHGITTGFFDTQRIEKDICAAELTPEITMYLKQILPKLKI